MKINQFVQKCIILAAAAVLLFSFASCKKEEQKSALREASSSEEQAELLEKAKKQSGIDEDTTEEDASSQQNTSSSSSEENQTPNSQTSGQSSSSNSQSTSSQASRPQTYTAGTLTDKVYESNYTNLKFELPSGFEMEYSPEDIKTVNAQLASSENEGSKYMKYEMSALNRSENIQVIVSVDGNKGDFDEVTYLAYVAQNYETTVDAEVDRTATYQQIGGDEYAVMKIKIPTGSIRYCARKQGDDIISIIVLCPQDEDEKAQSTLDSFKPYS